MQCSEMKALRITLYMCSIGGSRAQALSASDALPGARFAWFAKPGRPLDLPAFSPSARDFPGEFNENRFRERGHGAS